MGRPEFSGCRARDRDTEQAGACPVPGTAPNTLNQIVCKNESGTPETLREVQLLAGFEAIPKNNITNKATDKTDL